jgi:hypothetical protein
LRPVPAQKLAVQYAENACESALSRFDGSPRRDYVKAS